jgi:subtilase family serine protease
MLFSKRPMILSKLLSKNASRVKEPRRRGRRDSQFVQQPICWGPAVEALESRQMLSAVATPTFVIEGHAAAGIRPAVSPGVAPIDPAQMDAAYGVNAISFNGTVGSGAGQTIAIVDAYNDPNILSDATSFNSQWGLQQFNVSGGPTLKVLNETGGTSLPANSSPGGWDLEESLDVEWAHSIAPEANIILFEANSNSDADLFKAVDTAAGYAGVSVVSMSWSGGESSSETGLDSNFVTPNGHQGVTFLAATGDNGSPSGYPAYSPDVVAVGGTTLDINSSGTYLGESAWSGTGGGISVYESIPSYQNAINGANGASKTNRNVPDVAMDADPNSGVYVLDSYDGGWFQVGGTSLATPMWGGLVAIANQGRSLLGESSLNGATQTLPTLYSLPSSDFNDITSGSNGTYSAGAGYDLVTGLGTPIANLLVPALAGYGSTQPPTVSSPSTASLTENSSLTFSSANGNAISVADASAGTNADSLTLSVSHGTLTLASTSGLTFTGTNGTPSFTVSGTVSNLDAALNGLIYTPTSGYTGSDSLGVSITDP